VLNLLDFDGDALPTSFATLRKPIAQFFGKVLWIYAKARLEPSIAGRQRIVKIRGICEVAHAEAIEPIKRTRLPLAIDHHIDSQLLCVHKQSIYRLRNFHPAASTHESKLQAGLRMQQHTMANTASRACNPPYRCPRLELGIGKSSSAPRPCLEAGSGPATPPG
jgi:hypothetical protein